MFWWDSLTLPAVYNESSFTVMVQWNSLWKHKLFLFYWFSTPVLSFLENHGMCMLVYWLYLSLVYRVSLWRFDLCICWCWAPQTLQSYELFSLWLMNFPCAQCAVGQKQSLHEYTNTLRLCGTDLMWSCVTEDAFLQMSEPLKQMCYYSDSYKHQTV